MEKIESTEIEAVLQNTLAKQSRRIGELILQLDLAHSQIEYFKSKEKESNNEPESAE